MGNVKGTIKIPRGPDPNDPKATLTKGFCFIEFETAEEAQCAVKNGSGYKLDKTHIFACNLLQDVVSFADISPTFVEPEKEEYQDREDFCSWLTEPNAADQFVTRHQDETTIWWNMKTEPPEKSFG